MNLIWDDWNIQHIARHSVVPNDVEIAIKDPVIKIIEAHKDRYMLIGRSETRILAIIVNRNLDGRYYVVSARDAGKKERDIYRKEK